MWYAIETEQDDNGALLVTVPAFPEITTFAESLAEAPARAADAIEEAIAARMHDGVDVPSPLRKPQGVSAELGSLTSLKLMLYTLCRHEGITRAELSRRLNWKREQVDRLFRLEHNSRLDQLEAAFRAILHPLRFSVEGFDRNWEF
jgi:antitoxin HicB